MKKTLKSSAKSSDRCVCGSGRQYKRCCMPLDPAATLERSEKKRIAVRTAEGEAIMMLFAMMTEIGGQDFFDDALSLYAPEELLDVVLAQQSHIEYVDDPHVFAFHVFAFLNFSVDPTDQVPKTAGRLLLEARLKDLGQNLLEFVRVANQQSYRWLLIEKVEEIGFVTVMDVHSREKFRVRDVGLAGSGSAGNMLLGMVYIMWGDPYLLGSFPRPIPGVEVGMLLQEFNEALKEFPRDQFNKFGALLSEQNIQNFLKRIIFFKACLKYLNPQSKPILNNTDGDLLSFQTVSFNLSISTHEATTKLCADDKSFVAMNIYQGPACINPEITWYGQNPKSDLAGDVYTRGQILFSGSLLIANVNSVNRANKVRAEIESKLGTAAKFISCKKDVRDTSSEAANLSTFEPPPEVVKAMQDKLDRYFINWVDSPVPAFGGATPRQAAKDPKFRAAVESLLLDMETRGKKSTSPNQPCPDFDAIRSMLFDDQVN